MVIIVFNNGADWFKANWVFRQIAKDVISQSAEDSEIVLALEKAEAFGALDFTLMDKGAATKTLLAIKRVAENTLNGSIAGLKDNFLEDAAGLRMYLDSVSELLTLIRKAQDDEQDKGNGSPAGSR